MRFRLVVVAAALLSPSVASATQPNGLDCDKEPQIPAPRCAEWKARNPSGKLWCRWNLKTGAIDSVYGHDEPAVAPGLDFVRITRESARSDNATRTLLEAYGRQQIRAFESLFGFKAKGYELELTDFMRRPGGVHRAVQADGTTKNTPLPAISTLHFQQIVHQVPLDGASMELQVDDANNLVSVFSHFVPDLPPNVPPHQKTLAGAVQAVVDALAPGAVLAPGESVTGFASYSLIGG